jgi:hypothetical protein
MKKVLLLAVMGLFLGAGAANACDAHKAKAAKTDKASVAATTAVTAPVSTKKDCSPADKAACSTSAAAKANCETKCGTAKKGVKMTEESTKTATPDKKS